MRGRSHFKAKIVAPDMKYKSEILARFINKVMLCGKKATAKKLVYSALDIIGKKTGQEPLIVFEKAVDNASPILEVRSRRIGGANYQVPREVQTKRRFFLAAKWIIKSARDKSGESFDKCLAQEILDSFENKGSAIKKKDELHKMAEANRAFAHFGKF